MLSLLGAIDPAWIALIGTILGGVGLKVAEKFLNKHAEQRDDRKDYREEINELRTRLDTVENEVTFWRNRFYEEQEDNAMLRVLLIQNGVSPPNKRVVAPSPDMV